MTSDVDYDRPTVSANFGPGPAYGRPGRLAPLACGSRALL